MDDLTPWNPGPPRRVGDTERADACDRLADHFAAGRLTETELNERLAAAVRARTERELVVLLSDLGPAAPTTPGPRPATPARPSGVVLLALLVLVGSVVVAGILLLVLGAYSVALFAGAAVGGTAAFTGGLAAAFLLGRLRAA